MPGSKVDIWGLATLNRESLHIGYIDPTIGLMTIPYPMEINGSLDPIAHFVGKVPIIAISSTLKLLLDINLKSQPTRILHLENHISKLVNNLNP